MTEIKKKNPFNAIFILLIIMFFLSISTIVGLITDYYWFDNLGFAQIFLISLKTKLGLFFAATFIAFTFFTLNFWVSSKFADAKKQLIKFKYKLLIAAGLSLVGGFIASANWFVVLQYFNQFVFNIPDPIFLKDVSFYVFSLPFFTFVWKFVIVLVAMAFVFVLLDYMQLFIAGFKTKTAPPPGQIPNYNFDFKTFLSHFKSHALGHLTVLLSLFFLLLAFRHYIDQFSIMFSEAGIVVGAGYTDVIAFLPIVKFAMFLAILVAVVLFVWMFIAKKASFKKKHFALSIIILYVLFIFVVPSVIPALIQSLKVSPNELNLERPYIDNNIEFTRIAYGLDSVEENHFDVEQGLTSDILDNESETIDNVRILDWRPLTQTYKQTQEIRLYYDLAEVDIDRYTIDGKYTQVMLAPRELNQNQIASNAKTWINTHLVYTHGFGLVMSPVNKVTSQGLPDYYVKDVPPDNIVGEPSLNIVNPRIYYGEQKGNFVLVNTKTEEFDYPQGNSNQYLKYNGLGGVKLDTAWKKILMSIRFVDLKILLSSDLTPESRVMFDRHIQQRIAKITPFIHLDSDPYMVIDDGRLVWIQDAYTTTGNFPYSAKVNGINYIRNSVKIVVDAFNGGVTYYVIDPSDPMIQTYNRIFPNQFKSFDQFPESLKAHLRYPVDLFKIQSFIYGDYHMEEATVFYNKEDAWQIPSEIYGVGQKVPVEPYYVIMKLPGEIDEEFMLMTSFTPIKKDNMIAWMAARSDGDQYGKLVVYKFPKDKLVFGPLQVEAKIDQDSEISQQLTLWSQQGSRVTRGNLLIIPIKNSILYVEPLYIQAETGQLPELKRVIVSDGERVVMEVNFGEALAALFGASRKDAAILKSQFEQDNNLTGTNPELIVQANVYYEKVLESMNDQNWSAIGENFEKLGDVLNALEE
ncbi:UPF0182 family protein [Candidatus Woesearchaeota archaeon]|jgi:uncharacterized protein|nr:UPF0182 family protein [Candidatus Woesearchaeota archaeon]